MYLSSYSANGVSLAALVLATGRSMDQCGPTQQRRAMIARKRADGPARRRQLIQDEVRHLEWSLSDASRCGFIMDPAVRKMCDEIRMWRRAHGDREPRRNSDNREQSRIARHKGNLKSRCSKAIGVHPSQRQLIQDEVRYFEWCLSDAALQEESPDWIARESDAGQCGINTASDGSHGSRVPVTVASGYSDTGVVAVQVNGGAWKGQRRQAEHKSTP